MIRFIAAIDSKRGIADEHGVPWQGKLPTDVAYYRDKVRTGTVLMGYGLYKELSKPYPGGINYVATSDNAVVLRPGFEKIADAREWLRHQDDDVWNLGGAGMYASTIDLADELYLTRIDGDFGCTKFFPEFENNFKRISSSPLQAENGIPFQFEVWQKQI